MIISFAWTTPAVVLGEKCETRRDWKPSTFAMVSKIIEERSGVFDAWTKSPRCGGQMFGRVRGLEVVPGECCSTLPGEAWELEGFHVLQALGAEFKKGYSALDVWSFWRTNEIEQTLFRFELLELNALGRELAREASFELLGVGGPVPLREAIKRKVTV